MQVTQPKYLLRLAIWLLGLENGESAIDLNWLEKENMKRKAFITNANLNCAQVTGYPNNGLDLKLREIMTIKCKSESDLFMLVRL